MNPNYYEKQKDRALKRKYELVKLKGGKCEICGYDKNYCGFDFHHVTPNEKEFQLDSRHLSNTSIEKLTEEANKCMLVCSNCHRELHNPDFEKEKVLERIEIINDKHISIHAKNNKRQAICKKCGIEFDYVKRKVYCSKECRDEGKVFYPTFDEVIDKYKELNSWEKVADFFNVTRRIIQGIRRKH